MLVYLTYISEHQEIVWVFQAMVARGYKGDPAKHHIYFLTKLSIKASDWVAIGGLLVLLLLSIWSEIMLPV
jgi:energy-coupling factor transporter transmembrane protein EcfT